MGQISIDLGALLSGMIGDQTPQANPYYGAKFDEDSGQYMDKNGNFFNEEDQQKLQDHEDAGTFDNVTKDPYHTPGWGTRTFHPDVANYEMKNNIASENNLQAGRQLQDESNNLNARQFSQLPDSVKASFGSITPTQAGILNGGNNTAQNNESVAGSIARINNGTPQVEADALKEQAKYNLRSLYSRNMLGVPEHGAASEDSSYLNNYFTNRANIPLIQPRANLEGLNIGNATSHAEQDRADMPTSLDTQHKNTETQNIVSTGLRQTAPIDAATEINQANTKAAIAAGLLKDVGTTVNNNHLTTLGTARELSHPAPMNNLMMIDKDGRLVRNPIGLSSTFQTMNALQDGGLNPSKGSGIISTGAGTHIIPTPTTPSNPVSTKTEAKDETQKKQEIKKAIGKVVDGEAKQSDIELINNTIPELFKKLFPHNAFNGDVGPWPSTNSVATLKK